VHSDFPNALYDSLLKLHSSIRDHHGLIDGIDVSGHAVFIISGDHLKPADKSSVFVKSIGTHVPDKNLVPYSLIQVTTADIRTPDSVSTASSIIFFCNTDTIERLSGNVATHIRIRSMNKYMEFDLQLPHTFSCHVPLKFTLEQAIKAKEEVEEFLLFLQP
jgi:hypothetical protein